MFKYLREDVYFCYGCGFFHERESAKKVDIPYTDMPADFALHVMDVRQNLARRKGKRRNRRRFDDL
jgi:hypothetical protein